MGLIACGAVAWCGCVAKVINNNCHKCGHRCVGEVLEVWHQRPSAAKETAPVRHQIKQQHLKSGQLRGHAWG